MKIRISEVWNLSGKTQEIGIIEAEGNPTRAVYDWIEKNRPDLSLANTVVAHGFHAKAI